MNQAIKRKTGSNPFVGISLQWRMLLIAYIVIYNILTPGLREVVANSSAPLSGARTLTEILYQVLLFAPLFLYRPRFGWLHPLIFSNLFSIGKGLIKSLGQLLAPLAIGSPPAETLINPQLEGFTSRQMAWATLEHQWLSILALLCYYGGFFFAQRYTDFDFKPKRLRFSRSRLLALCCLAVVGISAAVAIYWVQQHGGLGSYLVYFIGGRRNRMRGEVGGSIFFVVGLGVIATLVWYALDEKAPKRPLFWVAVAYAIPVNFFLTGSRSSVFNAAVLFLMVWMLRNEKVPTGKAVALAVSGLLLLNVMGEFRGSAHQGRMDWSVFTETSITEAVEGTQEEVNDRQAVGGGVGVIASVPEDVGFLMGKGYAKAVFFFVPRFIWENKPRAPGGLNGEVILGHVEGGAAIPVGPVSEAYWNFGLPGIVLVFFLYGLFHKGLVRTLRRYPFAPVFVMYVLALTALQPVTNVFTLGMRNLVAALGLLFAVGGFAWHSKT